MIGRTTQIQEPTAKVSARVSLFALLLIFVALLAHRISWLTTPVALNLLGAGYILAALGFALGLVGATSIWIRGRAGAWSCAWGLLIAAGLWMWPAAVAPTYLAQPKINDVSTNTVSPPLFTAAGRLRGPGANSVTYPGARFAVLQAQAYPDIRTLVIPRPAEEVYEITLDLLRGRRGLGWKVIVEEAPQTRQSRPGIIEATDRTMILGFTDDIAIRIGGTDNEARVDIRSAARFGVHDLGTNATRIRKFVRELSTRLDATGPVGVAARGGVRINRAEAPGTTRGGLKRPIERTSEKAVPKR